jgi:hypothetical protein
MMFSCAQTSFNRDDTVIDIQLRAANRCGAANRRAAGP